MALIEKDSLFSINPLAPNTKAPETPKDLTGAYAYRPKPLSEFKTDFTSLKFGQDQRLGGSSKQPYIVFPIESPKIPLESNQITPALAAEYYLANRTSLDYPVRGGGMSNKSYAQTISSKIDAERIKKFLEDKPRGDAFVRKQKELQYSNPLTETSTTLLDNIQLSSEFEPNKPPTPGILQNSRIYNPTNTLVQVASSGTGQYTIRTGNSTSSTGQNYYADTVAKQRFMQPNQVRSTNRLLVLRDSKLINNNPTVDLTNQAVLTSLQNLGISPNRLAIRDYPGGPGSVYGLGNTTTARATDTAASIQQAGINDTAVGLDGLNYPVTRVNTGLAMSYGDLAFRQENSDKQGAGPLNMYDFVNGNDVPSREAIYNLTSGVEGLLDAINAVEAIGTGGDPWGGASVDMIRFGFEGMSNDVPGNSTFLQFRAYLTNGLNDSNQGMYNTFKYAGRGEDFFTYQGFSRTISFGFRLVADSYDLLYSTYKKLNYLISQVYPDYNAVNNIMRAPLVRVTVGDYIYRMPGFLESVNVTVEQDSSWEIYSPQMPHFVTVDISFRPIMEILPKRSLIDKPGGALIMNGVINPVDFGFAGDIGLGGGGAAVAAAAAPAPFDAQVPPINTAAINNNLQQNQIVGGNQPTQNNNQTGPASSAAVQRRKVYKPKIKSNPAFDPNMYNNNGQNNTDPAAGPDKNNYYSRPIGFYGGTQ